MDYNTMEISIREFELSDISALNPMYPVEWNFDFETFAHLYFNTSFFKGFTMTDKDKVIGFANVFIFNNISWLGNIIVDNNYRGHGLGTRITENIIDYARNIGVCSHQLIATKLGGYVYNKLGFTTVENYCFYSTEQSIEIDKIHANIHNFSTDDFQMLCNLDKLLTGEDRLDLLKMHLKGAYVFINKSDLEGYYLPNLAYGLILAKTEIAGTELLKLKIRQGARKVVITSSNQSAAKLLNSLKFEEASRAARMLLGENNNWQPKALFARGAGYCG